MDIVQRNKHIGKCFNCGIQLFLLFFLKMAAWQAFPPYHIVHAAKVGQNLKVWRTCFSVLLFFNQSYFWQSVLNCELWGMWVVHPPTSASAPQILTSQTVTAVCPFEGKTFLNVTKYFNLGPHNYISSSSIVLLFFQKKKN